jgi:hypothetical protein
LQRAKGHVFLLVYVDDILIAAGSMEMIRLIKQELTV